MPHRLPLISILGVPNTGKSTLFNRLIGERRALVHSQPGMTRDVFQKKFSWEGKSYLLQDTGGFFEGNDWLTAEIKKKIFQQAGRSDLIIVVFDGRRELLGYEKDFFLEIKRLHKPLILVINKIDHPEKHLPPSSYYSLKNDLVCISAEHNLGIEELGAAIVKEIGEMAAASANAEELPRLCIVGKPNVGKSSLANRILNDEKVIVSPVPGTTRDSIDLELRRNNRSFILVDNAGMRKLQKVKEETESAAVIRAEKSILKSDIIIFVIDLARDIDQNDLLIAKKIIQAAKPVIIAGNKWDLVEAKERRDNLLQDIRHKFNSLYFAQFIAVSAKTGKNINELIDRAIAIEQKQKQKIRVAALNKTVQEILKEKNLIDMNNARFAPKFVSIESQRPLFIKFFSKSNAQLKTSDELFLKKRLNRELGLEGIPLFFKTSSRK